MTAQAARDCYEIAAELCRLDALKRLHQTADVKDAASVAAACILYHFGWRLKPQAAPRAVELNAMDQQQLDEWAKPSVEYVAALQELFSHKQATRALN